MYHQEFKLLFDRAQKTSGRLQSRILSETVALRVEYATYQGTVPFSHKDSLTYQSGREGERWGEPWDNALFHLTAQIPGSWQDKPLALQVNFSGEAILFDHGGVPLYGFTNSSYFQESFTKEIYHITEHAQESEWVEFWLDCAAYEICGMELDYDPDLATLHPHGRFSPIIRKARVGIFDDDVFHLSLEFEILCGLAKALGANDYRACRALRVMTRACDVLQDNVGNATKARKILKEFLTLPASSSAMTAHAVGHAHLDVAWQWPIAETIRKVGRTFSSQLKMLEQYPEYIFGASQPQLYDFCRRYYPELYRKVKKEVAGGRWEIQGGMWVEADCNLPHGESLVRQILYGKNFFRDEFGIEVENIWLPDAFGYSAALPQIIRKSGCKYFLTNKLCVNQFNSFPYGSFRWRGIDGSTVIAHCPPEKNYNSALTPEQMIPAANTMPENDFMTDYLCLFGIGDGGGGPKEEYIERGLLLRNLDGVPKVQMGRANDFFALLKEKYAEQLPVWDGELYVELHRGTLTSQSRTKRCNRKLEQQLLQAEIFFSALPLNEFPQTELGKIWKALLLNQFHDILPGSSIGKVYEDAERSYAAAELECRQLVHAAAMHHFAKKKDSLLLVNTLSVTYCHSVELPSEWSDAVVSLAGGKDIPIQLMDGKVFGKIEIPPLGAVELVKRTGRRPPANSVPPATATVLENEKIRYIFNASGQVIEAWDKEIGRAVLAGPGNNLSLYHDRPNFWEAWDIDRFYRQEKIEDGVRCRSVTPESSGPLRQSLLIEWSVGEKSTIRQQAVLDAGSKRLDFETEADWHETRKMLRVDFPPRLRSPEGAFDIQYGFLKRPLHSNTSWELARFEVVGHKYADLSETAYGVALLNDCKYGYAIRDTILDLCLLRSPKSPDWNADQGAHRFTYALLPHCGNLVDSDVMSESAMLNRPPLLLENCAGKFIPPCQLREAAGISLETIKKAEKENSWIVRLVETRGATIGEELHLNGNFRVSEVDLMEWSPQNELQATNNSIPLEFTPFEIKTLRLIPE